MTQDFEKYAQQRAQKGAVADSWIRPFEQFFLYPHTDRENLRILDYGFGDGRYFEFFTKYFDPRNIHGVEVSRLRVERAQARGWQNAIYLDLMEKLPYQDGFFDFVNMVEIIEHIPLLNIHFYLSELQRIIKPDGVLLLTTPNYPIKRVYDILDAFRMHQWFRLKDDPTHVAYYNHRTLRSLLVQYFESVSFFAYKEGNFYRRWKVDLLCHKILAVCSCPRKYQGGMQEVILV